MDRLGKSLASKKLQLYVSLPANDPILAEAALGEGADGLKVHMNVRHRASGNDFGKLDNYFDEFREIRAMFDGPLGVVPGGHHSEIREVEIQNLERLGFDFLSIFAHHMPLFLLETSMIKATFAVDYSFDFDLLEAARSFPVGALEASIICPDEYGRPLLLSDLLKYRTLVLRSSLPVIVPTQANIKPQDVRWLATCGVKAILIGAIVTSDSSESLKATVASFRNAIDRI